MSLRAEESEKLEHFEHTAPNVTIFLRPIASPAALGLAGFAGSTFITASWMANWWGNDESPTIFFPFVMVFGGLAQFIAGFFGFPARDMPVTVIHTMWGSLWIAIGLLYLLVATGALEPHSIKIHFSELASWFIVLLAFTWSGAIAALSRDMALSLTLFFLAIGSTLAAAGLYQNGDVVGSLVKAAAYFFIFSSITAWWRVTSYLFEEAFVS